MGQLKETMMIEQAMVELTTALNANTAALMGTTWNTGSTPKVAKVKLTPAADKKAADDSDEVVEKPKSEPKVSQEEMVVAVTAFLKIENKDNKIEYQKRLTMVRELSKKYGVEKASLIPAKFWAEAKTWAEKQTEVRAKYDVANDEDKTEDEEAV
jgi:hypothetical protein